MKSFVVLFVLFFPVVGFCAEKITKVEALEIITKDFPEAGVSTIAHIVQESESQAMVFPVVDDKNKSSRLVLYKDSETKQWFVDPEIVLKHRVMNNFFGGQKKQ